jgi:hypothetical protein
MTKCLRFLRICLLLLHQVSHRTYHQRFLQLGPQRFQPGRLTRATYSTKRRLHLSLLQLSKHLRFPQICLLSLHPVSHRTYHRRFLRLGPQRFQLGRLTRATYPTKQRVHLSLLQFSKHLSFPQICLLLLHPVSHRMCHRIFPLLNHLRTRQDRSLLRFRQKYHKVPFLIIHHGCLSSHHPWCRQAFLRTYLHLFHQLGLRSSLQLGRKILIYSSYHLRARNCHHLYHRIHHQLFLQICPRICRHQYLRLGRHQSLYGGTS